MSLKLLKSLAPVHYSEFALGRAGAGSDISFMKGKMMLDLPDCARHLARLRPTVEPDKRVLVSTLAQQCKRYHQNPDLMRPIMMKVIDALAAPNADEGETHG
jgi:hypothetical protein